MADRISETELHQLRTAHHSARLAEAELEFARANFRLVLLRFFAKYDRLEHLTGINLTTGDFEARSPDEG